MNRRKKGIQILKVRVKKANAKLSTQTKPKYISKAQRARLDNSAIENDPVTAKTQT